VLSCGKTTPRVTQGQQVMQQPMMMRVVVMALA
jgi:hypothetical protein